MKEKILAQLIAKNPGVSKVVLGLLADKLAVTVTEESAIEGAISELDKGPISIKDYADFLQKEADKRVADALKKAGKTDPPKDDPKNDPPKNDDPIAAQLAAINEKLALLEKEKTQGKLSEKLSAALKEKKIPLALAKGRVPQSEEELESVLSEIETDWTETKQQLANEGFAQVDPPKGGNSGDVSKATVEADWKAWAAKNQTAPAAK